MTLCLIWRCELTMSVRLHGCNSNSHITGSFETMPHRLRVGMEPHRARGSLLCTQLSAHAAGGTARPSFNSATCMAVASQPPSGHVKERPHLLLSMDHLVYFVVMHTTPQRVLKKNQSTDCCVNLAAGLPSAKLSGGEVASCGAIHAMSSARSVFYRNKLASFFIQINFIPFIM
jgi:hypothetical protein